MRCVADRLYKSRSGTARAGRHTIVYEEGCRCPTVLRNFALRRGHTLMLGASWRVTAEIDVKTCAMSAQTRIGVRPVEERWILTIGDNAVDAAKDGNDVSYHRLNVAPVLLLAAHSS